MPLFNNMLKRAQYCFFLFIYCVWHGPYAPEILDLSHFCWPKKAGSKEVLQKSDQPFGQKLLSKLLRPRLSCWEVLNSSGNHHL